MKNICHRKVLTLGDEEDVTESDPIQQQMGKRELRKQLTGEAVQNTCFEPNSSLVPTEGRSLLIRKQAG